MASGKGNTNAAGLLQAIYQATFTDLSTLLANAGSPLTVLYVSLHTGALSASSAQNTSEAAYTGYARVSVARTTGGWTLANETITNAAAINFPACTGGSETETYVGIGTAASGAGTLLWWGSLTNSLAVSNGITPSISAGQISITES
jgi:hypothetical protein